MNKLFLVPLLFLIFACQQDPKEKEIDYAIISGSITNPAGDKVVIYAGQEKLKDISLDSQGKFTDTLKNIEPGFLTLIHGRENSAIYIAPGYDLDLTLDTAEFDESISYSGRGSEANNYLASKYLKDEEMSGEVSTFYSLEEDEFLKKLEEIQKNKKQLLNEANNLDKEFKELEEKNLRYEYLAGIQNYPSYHEYYAKKPDFKPSTNFSAPLDSLDYTLEDDYRNSSYYQGLVQNKYNKMIRESENPSEVFKEINALSNTALKEDLAKNLAYGISPNSENNEAYYNGIMAMTSDKELKERVSSKYEKVQKLTKGNPSPVFTDYENHKGGTMSLQDLKGKYVYVDVWATWCGPCKAEIPYLKEVEEKYHGKNIAFVSTSIDKAADHNSWVEMVKDKELGGIQLMADNDWNSKFVTDYAIEGIPRFILIDPEGNIVTADAPRPSNQELQTMFESLDI